LLQFPLANAPRVNAVDRLFAERGVRLVRVAIKPVSSVPDQLVPAVSKIVPEPFRVSVIPPLGWRDTVEVWTAVLIAEALSGVVAFVKFHSTTLTDCERPTRATKLITRMSIVAAQETLRPTSLEMAPLKDALEYL